MYYEAETKTRGQRDAITSILPPADLQITERSPVKMACGVENFRRMSAKKVGVKGKSQARRLAEETVRKLFWVALMMGIGMAAVATDAAARTPIACGTTYTVARGDTLFKIAERAFGNGRLYKQIFAANGDVLANSASVEIGIELLIPCPDGAGSVVREDVVREDVMREDVVREDAVAQEPHAEPSKPEATPVAATMEATHATPGLLRQAVKLVAIATLPIQSIAAPVFNSASPASIANDGLGANDGPGTIEITAPEPQPVVPRIRLLTGSGFAPFADEDLPKGGMITDLVLRAMKAAVPGKQSRVTFVNDWAAHLNYLLADGAFDVSFPWYKPDCSKSERLNAEMQRRCAGFEFSNPIFEVRVGFYTRRDDALVEIGSLAALSGKRLCRPNGQFTFDLEQEGLMEPNASVETQYTAEQCFVRLVEGQVDVVTLVKSKVDEQLRQLGIADSVTEIDGLESAQTLHAVVAKRSPNGQAHLDLINQGLAELMASGKWFEVVAYHQGRQLALMN